MPEIAISTNAGGWFHSNFNVDCSEYLCEHGRHVPTDVNNPDFVPIVFTMIRELLQFTSSPFIHLGHDERETNLPCFAEGGIKGRQPRFVEYEESLGKLLQFIGVTDDRVVRWQNEEEVHHSGRIGSITQYSSQDTNQILGNGDASKSTQPWIGTVNVRVGGPWKVYSSTRKLAEKTPRALVAEVGAMGEEDFERDTIEHRLVAFSMGTLDKPAMSKSEFMQEFTKVCTTYFETKPKSLDESQSTNRSQALCHALAMMSEDAPSLANFDDQAHWKERADAVCKERTQPSKKITFKEDGSIPTALSLSAGITTAGDVAQLTS